MLRLPIFQRATYLFVRGVSRQMARLSPVNAVFRDLEIDGARSRSGGVGLVHEYSLGSPAISVLNVQQCSERYPCPHVNAYGRHTQHH